MFVRRRLRLSASSSLCARPSPRRSTTPSRDWGWHCLGYPDTGSDSSVTVVYASGGPTVSLTHTLTTAWWVVRVERALLSSRVHSTPPLCTEAAVHQSQHRVTRQAAHVLSSSVSLSFLLSSLCWPSRQSLWSPSPVVSSVRPLVRLLLTSSLSVSLRVVWPAHPPPLAVGATLSVLVVVSVTGW